MSATWLYRSMLREAGRLTHYNVREYAKRRVKLGFAMTRHLAEDDATEAYRQGLDDLASLRRQVTLYNLYPPPEASVMEAARNPIMSST